MSFPGLDLFAIDTNKFAYETTQINWLKNALKSSTADHKIVLSHHPMYSVSLHAKDEVDKQNALRQTLGPILCENDAHLFSGHEHDLEVHLETNCRNLQLISGAAGKKRPVYGDLVANPSSGNLKFAKGDSLGFMIIKTSSEGMKIKVYTASGVNYSEVFNCLYNKRDGILCN